MNELKHTAIEADVLDPLITCGLLPVVGLKNSEVIEVWKPLITTGAFYLHDAELKLSLSDALTGDEIISASFKAGRCIDQTFTVDRDQQKDCLGELKAKGFRFSPALHRWAKPGSHYTWRIQSTDHNRHVIMCRRLLISKGSKS